MIKPKIPVIFPIVERQRTDSWGDPDGFEWEVYNLMGKWIASRDTKAAAFAVARLCGGKGKMADFVTRWSKK